MRGGGGTRFRTGRCLAFCGAGGHSSHSECVLNTSVLQAVVIASCPCCRGVGIPSRRWAFDLCAVDRFELALHPCVDFRGGKAAARHQVGLVDDASDLKVGTGCDLCAGATTAQQQRNPQGQMQRKVSFAAVHARYYYKYDVQNTKYVRTICKTCRLVKQFFRAPSSTRSVESGFQQRQAHPTKTFADDEITRRVLRVRYGGSARPSRVRDVALRV